MIWNMNSGKHLENISFFKSLNFQHFFTFHVINKLGEIGPEAIIFPSKYLSRISMIMSHRHYIYENCSLIYIAKMGGGSKKCDILFRGGSKICDTL